MRAHVEMALGTKVPDGWEATTFRTLCDRYGGALQTGPFGSQLHSSDYSDAGTPVVMPQDINAGRIHDENAARVSAEHVQRLARHRLEVGDILYSRRGDVTRFAIVQKAQRGWLCGTGCLRIRPAKAPLDSAYVRWFLESIAVKQWLIREAKGATMPNLNTKILASLPLLLPPLPEQKRIAAILDKADEIRRKRAEAIKLTEELLKSAFLEMFGDPVTNPKGWEVRKLGELVKVKSGEFLPAKNLCPGPNAVYGGNGINGRHAEYMFERPVLTIGRVGVYCGAVHRTEPRSWVTDNALYVAEQDDCLEELYLEWALRFANLNQYAGRAAQPLISGNRIYPVDVVVPPLGAQRRFSELTLRHAEVLCRAAEAETTTTTLVSSLTQRAFRGEL